MLILNGFRYFLVAFTRGVFFLIFGASKQSQTAPIPVNGSSFLCELCHVLEIPNRKMKRRHQTSDQRPGCKQFRDLPGCLFISLTVKIEIREVQAGFSTKSIPPPYEHEKKPGFRCGWGLSLDLIHMNRLHFSSVTLGQQIMFRRECVVEQKPGSFGGCWNVRTSH